MARSSATPLVCQHPMAETKAEAGERHTANTYRGAAPNTQQPDDAAPQDSSQAQPRVVPPKVYTTPDSIELGPGLGAQRKTPG